MSTPESTHGLACPNCGGVVPVPEGQLIVRCSYCNLRSLVHGERGVQRYQVPCRINREHAEAAYRGFLRSNWAIAGQAARSASLEEAFIAYLPFWISRARVLGWVFGQEKIGSGDNARWEPREIKIAEDMIWNGAACDVGEFGVDELPLDKQPLEPFDADALQASGLVFEPVGSQSDAEAAGEEDFSERVRQMAKLDQVAQTLVRFTRRRLGLFYYPLWVLRYLYRGRAFQVVVDGFTGKVLYGKAPGNTLFRAAVLVGGMALGAILAVDATALLLAAVYRSSGDDSGEILFLGLAVIAAGFGLMGAAYRKYRYGEQYEFRGHRQKNRRLRRRKEKGIYRVEEVKT
jgi:hypothetical protein